MGWRCFGRGQGQEQRVHQGNDVFYSEFETDLQSGLDLTPKFSFQCEENHGTFVRETQCVFLDDGDNPIPDSPEEKPTRSRLSR